MIASEYPVISPLQGKDQILIIMQMVNGNALKQILSFLICVLMSGSFSLSAQSYTVSQSGTYNIELDNPTAFSLNGDAVTQIPIGFNFVFFGNSYSDCFVGGDGFITFGGDPGSYCCGQNIPDPDPANNLIAVAWTNTDFSDGQYEVFGTAPYRRLVITFDLLNPCDSSYYGQVKLFETTNVIEIHTQHWNQDQCQVWSATQGLENIDGTEAIPVPGRNYNNTWHVDNGAEDYVSFTPNAGGPVTYSISETGTYNIEINNPTFFDIFGDTVTEIPIGFNFHFFGSSYSNCFVGGDGFIAFGGDPGSGYCCGQFIPNAAAPNNLIAAAWSNMDSGTAHYEIFGNAPFRRLVITLDLRNPCNEVYYGQVKLFETTNVIEIHTQEWSQNQCQGYQATQGIENVDGTVAYPVSGRNYNDLWTVSNGTNDFVSFTPMGGSSNVVYVVDRPNDYNLEFDTPVEDTIFDDALINVPIGFDFQYFGIPYSTCYLGQNGFLSFDLTDSGCCEGQSIPDPTGPNNMIAAGWINATNDDCCSQGQGYSLFSHETIGTAPNRRFVAYFLMPETCGQYYRGEIKLFEGSDIIEIHTDHWAQYNTPCNNATQGIENATGTQAYYYNGRVANTAWSVVAGSNDVVRFTPYIALPGPDAGITHITSEGFCTGSQQMSARIKNFGVSPIDSVDVQWEFDGLPQTPVHFTGTIPVAGDTLINLGYQTIVSGQNYSLRAWSSLPNNIPDPNNSNDTLSANIHSSLAGTFTIGGTSPDYTSFNAAVADLVSVGVCDTVIMNVRPGTYTEQVIIPHIPGIESGQVIFKSENGDSTSVILQYNATLANANYVIRFDSAHHVKISHITLNTLGTNFARAIEFKDFTHDNVIEHCAIKGRNAVVNTTAFACIYSDAFNSNNRIHHNRIVNGSYGFYHQYDAGGGGSSSPPDGIRLDSNVFIDFYNKAIYTNQTKAIHIDYNLIQSSKSGVRGIEVVNEVDSMRISNNTIYLSAGNLGLWTENVFPPSGKRARIFNNMVNVAGSTPFAGAGLYNCSRISIFHNTFRTEDPDGSYTFHFQSGVGTQDSVYNNIIANTGNGPVVYASTNPLFNSLDYNDYYTTSPLFGAGFISSTFDVANLNQWQHATNQDGHSLNFNPLFISNTNLHATNHLLNGAATPLLSTQQDIDGNTRNATHPDIGADEFTPVGTDAGITQILSPTLTCSAGQNIEVVLTNLGADTLHQVTIKWTINGAAQPDINYNHNLLPEGDTAHVILSQYAFSNHADTLKIWTSLPNGMADSQQINDTIQYRFRLPLNGIYTIGGSNPDFTTFKKAAEDLNTFQNCGPVVFRFRNGTYSEQVVIDSIPTTSAVNTVTFESESLDSSAVFLTFVPVFPSSNHSNVTLNGADYITFRHLGFQALTNSDMTSIELKNNATHLRFSHCRFEGTTFNTFNNYALRSFSNTGVQSFITIDHNYILNASYGIAMYNNVSATDFHITDNHFVNQVAKAIDIITTKNLYILNNTVESSASNNFTGIDLDNCYQTTEISGNYINTNNGNGLYLNSSNGNVKVFNNMVKVGGSAIGMNFWNCLNTKISFNSSRATGTGHGIEIAGGDSLQLKNNIFMSNSGRVVSSFAPPVHVISDYNVLYSVTGPIGYWNDITYSTLAAWQTGTGYDANSMHVDPQFVSTNDLHILADTIDGAGVPVAGINVDFDNNPRNATHPDIGADEIGANSDDAGVFAILPEMPFARGLQDVKAVIRNFGANTITSAQVHWKLNNMTQTTFNYTGSLPTLQQDTVILGQVNFALSTPYIIKSWTAQPNGTADLYNINDTLTTNTRYPAVSDTLTIGGSSPDLANFSAALTALSLGGVLDSVHFQLRNGIYHTVFTIPQTLGMDCNTPIVFESESGNPADVIWDNASLPNHTLVIDGADGLRFKNLTIRTVQAAYHAVYFANGANCNAFLGCVIEGVTTTSTSLAQVTILSYDTHNNDVEFIGNTIRGGSYGLYWFGAYNSSTGARVENNVFENSYYCGLTMSRLIAPVVHHNKVSSNTTYSYPYGIQITECSLHTLITANQILFSGKRGVGLYLAAMYGNAGQRNLIANNFVVLGNSSNSYGIHQAGCTYSNVYNNTVRLTGGNTSGYPYIRQYSTNINLRNNIFDNRAGGVAMYIESNESPLTSDYNDLYGTGSNLVYYNGVSYSDLGSWHATGFDLHSITEDPMYVNATSFEITSAALNAAGIPLTEVPADIQGELRDTSTPDIGCDEIALFNNDVGILSINYPKEPFPSGVNTVFIKFVNNGQDTLTSMQVDWEVDGIAQPTYAWMGLLPSAGTYDSLDIGEYNFAPYQTHSIKAWVSLPNTFADELASNDTLEVNDLYPALLGTYTIGGTNPDFDSIKTAVNVLNLGGAAGPVTFNIRTGTYLETLLITDFPGSDCNTPVIFQSATGDSSDVTITNLGLNASTITLNGADGVIFKKLTLTSVNPAFRNVVDYYNGANCNQFLNNHIKGYESNSSSTAHAVIISGNSLDTANVFRNNWIEHGAVGFYLLGNGVNAHTLIQNNFLDDNYYSAIYASSESGIHIIGNDISGGSASYYLGIYLEYCSGDVIIERNDIDAVQSDDIVRLEGCSATLTARGRIINNFIRAGGATGMNGLMLNNCQYYDIFHNSINVYSTTGSNALYYDTDLSLHFANNIASNKGAGNAVYGNNQTGFTSDYNDYYAIGNLGIWNGAGKSTIGAWQSATGQDAHSLAVNPQFASNTNLHISNILLNGSGQSIASVPMDIEGDIRTSPPDIGADEFVPSIPHDAGVFGFYGPIAPFAQGSNPVLVILKNYGSQTLTSANIRWLVNGIEQPLYHWTGSLLSAQDDTISVGNYSFAPHADHDIIFWSESPNGIPDSTHVNDTLEVNDLFPALNGVYTVGGVLPDFNLFPQLAEALNKGGILGNVTFNIRNGLYSTQFAITDFPRTAYNHQVIFQSESGDSSLVTLERNFYSPANNYIVSFSNAHRITFQRIGFSTNQGHGLEIMDASSDININRCRFTAPQLTYQNGVFVHIFSNTSSEDSVYIANNQFNLGGIGIQLSASWGDLEKNVSVLNNHFNNCFYRSIDVAFDDGLTLRGNTTYNTNINVYQAISVVASVNVKDISNNDIRMLGGGSCGLNLQSVYGTAMSPTSISNNYILIRNGSYNQVGIAHSYGDYNNFNYNTVRIENAAPGSIAFTDYYALNTHIHLRNCNFANYSGGMTIYNSWAPNSTNSTDYCNLYTTGPTLAQYYLTYANLSSLQAGTNQNLHGKSAEPLFADNSPSVFQAALDGTGIPISGVTTDIYGTTRNASTPDIGAKEFTLLTHNIGAKLLVSPATYCGLSNAEVVTMRIQNYGASTETGFNVGYSVDGAAWTIENVGALSVLPGGVQNYTFTPTENLSQVGIYTFTLFTSLGTDLNIHNDTIRNIEVEHIPALVLPVSNMIPTNGEADLEKTVSLSWAPAPDATKYDVYIWPFGQNQPGTPVITDLTQINTTYSDLNYGAKYNWRVVARNVCNQMVSGPIQNFSIRKLPDLVIDTVIAPVTAFSGQTIQIEWQVRNLGPGKTQSQLWSDAVYLSTDATLNVSFDTYLGAVQNLTALDSNIAYTNIGLFNVPNGFSGNFYVFVYSDRWNNLIESQNNNNWDRTPTPMMITLSPSPDLKVISVVTPSTTFSGQTIPVTATIKNIGTGPTQVSSWHDRVYFGFDPLNYGTGQYITTIAHNGILQKDSTYQIQANVSVPIGIFGERYVYVVSDFNNVVFENAAESNNVGISDTIDVILTPPPDLFAYDFTFPDTIHNNQVTSLNYELVNQGGSNVPNTSWYDQVYISQAPVFNTNFIYSTGYVNDYGPMIPNDPTLRTLTYTMPPWASGVYYYYVNLDNGNQVFEHTFESNNLIRSSGTFVVVNPDLHTTHITHPATVTAGQVVNLSWDMINEGPGRLYNRNWQTKVYLSNQPTLNVNTATLLKTLYYNTSYTDADDTLPQSTVVSIPNGISGVYYFHVLSDAGNAIYENGIEQNNTGSSLTTILISLPPYPDLVSREIVLPDTITAGELFSMQYEVANTGLANAQVTSTDSFYLSFSPTWNPVTNQVLGRQAVIPALNSLDSSSVNAVLAISTQQTSNVYYVYIKSDATAKVYEYLGESNNIKRSNAVFIKPAPSVDLHVDTLTSGSLTVYSGTPFSAMWKVTNQSSAHTSTSGWRDALYLSVDTILDRDLDMRFFETQVAAGGLNPGANYNKTAMPVIPNGLAGDYYLLVETDDLGVHIDHDSMDNHNTLRNNEVPVPLHIVLSPSPDLRPVLFSAPVNAYSGQPFTIVWSVKNEGNAAAQTWNDKIFLSTDNIINQGDVLLATEVRNGANLLPNQTLLDTVQVFVNSQLQGNYILLLKTDVDNTIYEHLGESNNQISRSISFTPPPPSDLLVTSIQLPDSTFAGNTISINWNTMNSGSNPTNGMLREIVYLSTDNTLDVDDRLFGLTDQSLYIPPGNSVPRSMTATVSGVQQEDYYALVQTDARDNITESNDTNNIGVSADLMNVSIEELFLDSLTVDSFYNGREHYFRLEIPLSEQGQNLRITVDGDSLGLYTEMYIKYGLAPTLSDFDQKYLYPFRKDQELIVEGVSGGTYYLMFKGQTSHAAGQRATILARIVDFELISIAPDKGVNIGQTTIEMLGTQMDTMRRVYLVRDSTVRILADTIYEINSYRAFATFNLDGKPPGHYTVQAVRWDGKIAELNEAFEIMESGEEPDLQVVMDYPGEVGRRSAPMKITIFMQNAGDRDIVHKVFRFEAPWGNQMARTYEDLISGNTQTVLEIPVEGAFGPPGILPPKAGNVIEIYAYSSPRPSFALTPVDE